MNIFKISIAVAGLTAATVLGGLGVANAQTPGRLSDVAYIAAARCEGLAKGSKIDAAAVKALLSNQDSGRQAYILDKADEVRQDAESQAKHAQGYKLQTIQAELGGACQTYLKS